MTFVRKMMFLCIALLVIIITACTNQNLDKLSNDLEKNNVAVEQRTEDLNEEEKTKKSGYLMSELQENTNVEYWNVISTSTSEKVFPVDVDLLYSYGDAFDGEKIVTSFNVTDITYDSIRYVAPHNIVQYFVSVIAEFEDRDEMKDIQSDETVAIVGVVSANQETSLTISITDCKIIATGIDAQIIKDEIKLSKTEQQEYVAAKGITQSSSPMPTDISESKFRRECQGIQMDKVLKEYEEAYCFNNYNEKKIWFYGTILQQIELSKTTTAYIVEYENECWYAIYTADDTGKISVGENVNVYGECIGVKTYISTQGQEKTIPVMRLKYFEKVVIDGE